MKFFLTFLFMSFFASSYGQSDKGTTEINGNIHFDQLEFNLGVISNKTPVVIDVNYENLGPAGGKIFEGRFTLCLYFGA